MLGVEVSVACPYRVGTTYTPMILQVPINDLLFQLELYIGISTSTTMRTHFLRYRQIHLLNLDDNPNTTCSIYLWF